MFSHSVRKHLRKTRLELLHKEYEDEIESLLKEIDELKGKNIHFQEQLKIVLDPIPVAMSSSPSECEGGTKAAEDKSCIDTRTSEEWNKKLQAAHDITKKVTDDIEKLKEANKKLRNENSTFVRENLRLKAEVESRSPQKFGRFTVAALQAKVDQYEREMNRLKKALERSDQYIEELECQVEHLKMPADQKQVRSYSENTALSEENVQFEGDGTALDCQEVKQKEIFLSLSDETSGFGVQDSKGTCSSTDGHPSDISKARTLMEKECSPILQKRTLAKLNKDGSTTWEGNVKRSPCKDKRLKDKTDGPTPSKDEEMPGCSSPGTSLLPFSSLQLNTPNRKNSLPFSQVNMKKPLTYLRKLMFDFPDETKTDSFSTANNENCSDTEKDPTYLTKQKSVFWNPCQVNSEAQKGNAEICGQKEIDMQPRKTVTKPKDQAGQYLFKRLQAISDDEVNRTRTSSETSMDAAFLDKISELDSMMSELESSQSPFHDNVTSNFVSSLSKKVTKLQNESKSKVNKTSDTSICPQSTHLSENTEHLTPGSFPVSSPCTSDNDFPLFGGESLVLSQDTDFQKHQSNSKVMLCNPLPQCKDQTLFQSSVCSRSGIHPKALTSYLNMTWLFTIGPRLEFSMQIQSALLTKYLVKAGVYYVEDLGADSIYSEE
ncbi:hypothetical protein FKM82_026201 [Ascaphus truei]